jgi:rhamnogalacturonan endolyase
MTRWWLVPVALLMASCGSSPEQPSATPTPAPVGKRQMENLNRGVVAVKVSAGVFVSWRLLGQDAEGIAFNLYRDGLKVNADPITRSTNMVDPGGQVGSTYSVRSVVNGAEQGPSETIAVWASPYLTIPLQTPSGYSPNDASVGDLDGDGQYEIVLKVECCGQDNSYSGVTGQPKLEAYELDGSLLWRIDLGINIREGAHYTQFMVYDLDGDGRSEVACKTAPGTRDGQGRNVILGQDDPAADYRNASGYILSGPEYLTIFDGRSGGALASTSYIPPRGNVSAWGDDYGNRADRFLAAIAYLDGTRPSLVMCRGYYTRAVLAAWNWRDGQLSQVWTFDTDADTALAGYRGQGNHNLSVGDVDGDGRDEIVYGAAVIDHDGRGLYTTRRGHGDAMHLSDMDPNRPGLEVFLGHEPASANAGLDYRDARTGALLFGVGSNGDVGRALAIDVDPRYSGFEGWVTGGGITGMYHLATGQRIASATPAVNFAVWWDADPLREILDGNHIDKWDYQNARVERLLTATECVSNNGTKSTPALSADLLGDWREEVLWRTSDGGALRLYTTTIPTDRRIYTLMHDLQYREAIAWQNVAYNQPPHTSFFLGDGMTAPPRPEIEVR